LTFDDSNADQLAAAQTMQAAGLTGTFYTITGSIGAPNYLTLADLQQFASYGDEIAGHTVNHPDLTLVPNDEALRQICDARATLTNWGFPQTDFAYPFSSVNAAVEADVKQCGYNSARGLGDIRTQVGCTNCPYVETMPPTDAYDLKAPDEVDATWTLQNLENTVTSAETHGGGWVILTFHHICDGCDPLGLSVTPALFASFTSWLQQHTAATPTTTVKTVSQVIGGAVQPLATGPAVPAVAGALTNSSLETPTTDATGISCWTPYQWGTNTATFTPVTPGHAGSVADQIVMSGYTDGAAGLYPTFDTGGCTPSATAGHTYHVTAWYESTTVTQFVAYYRDANGGFDYWTSSPYFAAASGWTEVAWTTPALPDSATGISFGLSIFSNGTLTVDDFGYADTTTLPAPVDAVGNASLETAGLNGLPECWTPTTLGTNDGTYSQTTPGHTGNVAGTITVTSYTDGSIQLLPTLGNSMCAPAAVAGAAYNLSAWYESNAFTQFAVYYETADGTWTYWTSSPYIAAASSWTQAQWTTPTAPAGTVAVAFGLSLFSVGSLTTDDYGFTPAS
jgi:peptidoglycan/xylan/chitin deacetylase (PgdA/CDA1 family)